MQIPPQISLDQEGQYCLTCLSGPVQRIFRDEKTYYECQACHQVNERSLVIDNTVAWWVDEQRTYWHESVGVLVMNERDEILCILRQIFPFAYALPAGHLDKGEEPKVAAARELHEEIGLAIDTPLEHVGDFDVPGDSCRRGSDHHRWHLYKAKISSKNKFQLSDEASTSRWFSLEDLHQEKKLVFPLKYIVDNFLA